MSIFSQPAAKTNPSRNGFDLSKRQLFTASAGQLLPIYSRYMLPGDHFKINVSSLTRTLPLNTDAFARVREYCDFFFVPYRLIYENFPLWVIQNSAATETSVSGVDVSFPTTLPYFNLKTNVYNLFFNGNAPQTDDLGFSYAEGASKLMDYLGYGQFYNIDAGQTWDTDMKMANYNVNPFRAAAYQKIYADFYRDSHWEANDIASWNLNAFGRSGTYQDLNFGLAYYSTKLFKMRYANYKKDILMSVHPNLQFGSVSVVPLSANSIKIYGSTKPSANANAQVSASTGEMFYGNYKTFDIQGANVSVLDLRMAQALQRWKEVTELNAFRYNEQVEAHFGFKVPDSRAQIAEFIDGWTNTINISEVVNTSDSNQGRITGKAVGVNQSNEIEYTAKEHGLIMAIYHVAPDIDYNQSRVADDNSMLDYEDFFIPEYQNLGLSDLQSFNYAYPLVDADFLAEHAGPSQTPVVPINHILAYQLRYAHYKSDIDEAHGAFSERAGDTYGSSNGLQKWIVPLKNVTDYISWGQNNTDIDYRFFKVNPACLDGLFATATNGHVDTDKMICNFYFDVKGVRPISVDGMPY